MEKKQYPKTYIQSSHIRRVDEMQEFGNRSLSALCNVVKAFGETLADAITYQKRGAYYKVEAEEARCRAWLKKTGAPSYMYDDALEKARLSLGNEALEYYDTLESCIHCRLCNTFHAQEIDLAADVKETADGAWVLNDEWRQRELEKGRREFSDWQLSDMADFAALRDMAERMQANGYDVIYMLQYRKEPEGAELGEMMMRSYSPGLDQRQPKPQESEN